VPDSWRPSLTLALLLATSALHAEEMESSGLRLGSVAMDTPAVMHERLLPLTRYLGQALRRPVTLHLSPNMKSAVKALAERQVDIAYLTPVAYLDAHELGQAQVVVKTVTQGQSAFDLRIVVHKDSPIRQVRDLAGKRFAFGDQAALLQRAVVVHAGMPLEKLGFHAFVGHYDNIARAVVSGEFDAGILKDTTAKEWERKGLRVLHQSPPLPPYNIAVGPHLSAEEARAIQKALIDLNPDYPPHRAALRALDAEYDGFAAATDAEYDVIRTLVAPFRGQH